MNPKRKPAPVSKSRTAMRRNLDCDTLDQLSEEVDRSRELIEQIRRLMAELKTSREAQ
jgi:hypothetical protein